MNNNNNNTMYSVEVIQMGAGVACTVHIYIYNIRITPGNRPSRVITSIGIIFDYVINYNTCITIMHYMRSIEDFVYEYNVYARYNQFNPSSE